MQEEIFELIEGKKYARLRELLSDMNPADIAQILEEIPVEVTCDRTGTENRIILWIII